MRAALGLSQSELAKKSNISQPVISGLESSKAQTSGHIPSIADALGVNAYWLETGHDQLPQFENNWLDGDLVIPVILAPGNCGGSR